MAPALILLPALIALAMLNRLPAIRVAQKVYIPCLLLVPMYLEFRLGGLFLNSTSIVSALLAVSGLTAWYRTLKFSPMDLCVIVYVLGAFQADAHVHSINLAFYAFLWTLSKCAFPYLIGRTLIEQTQMRTPVVRALVICLAILAIADMWEFRMQTNLFEMYTERIIGHSTNWGRMVRWGFQRTAGPFGHAITAGLIFATGLMLQFWLASKKSWEDSPELRFLRWRRKSLYVTLIMMLGLFMTQSRGPWIGFGFGLVVASIGFAKNRRRAAIISLSTLVIGAAVAYVVLDKYTAADPTKTDSQDQLNAEYRRNLYATYKPFIDEGGLWGWGTPLTMYHGTYSWVPSQPSVDNEYIRIAMLQGYLGFLVFVTMLGLCILRLIRLCATLQSRDDVIFAYCVLGVIVSASFTLTTVYLADPMNQILFLFFGWSESIRSTQALATQTVPVRTRQFVFERVFV